MVLAGGPLTPVVPAADDDLPLVKIAILACTTDRVWGTSKRLPVLAKSGVTASDNLGVRGGEEHLSRVKRHYVALTHWPGCHSSCQCTQCHSTDSLGRTIWSP